jgi:hypothetical protein
MLGCTTPLPKQLAPKSHQLSSPAIIEHREPKHPRKYREAATPPTPAAMDRLLRSISCALLLLVLPLAAALKFDLHAVQQHEAAKHERCIRNFVAKEQLVVVTAILDGHRGDGQRVDMHVRCSWGFEHGSRAASSRGSMVATPEMLIEAQIRDAMGNDYHRPKDVYGENRYAFTSHADSAFDVCFENTLTGSTSPSIRSLSPLERSNTNPP